MRGLMDVRTIHSSHHDDPSGATESQRQDPGEGMSSPVGQTPGKWYGKGNTCQLCGAIINYKGEITGTSKSTQRKLVSTEEKRHSSQKVEGRTELDLVQDDVDEAKRSLEEAHLEVQAAQSIPSGTGDGKNVPDHEAVGGEPGASRSMKTGQKKRLLGGMQKTKTMWERWYEANQGGGETTEQQGRHSTVHRFL